MREETLARRILDADRPETLRAIDLFEFQISSFRARKKVRRNARKFAAMKLMEHLQDAHQLQRRDIRAALEIGGYLDLFNEATRGGWLSLRKLPSDSAFDASISRRIEEAQLASDVINFLCEWKVMFPDKRTSISKAVFIARTLGKRGVAKTRAGKYWRRHAKNSIAIHLMLAKGFDHLLPVKISAREFANRLLLQARDLQRLRTFFAARDFVVGALPDLDEEKILRDIWLADLKLPEVPLVYEPLAERTISKLKEYISGED